MDKSISGQWASDKLTGRQVDKQNAGTMNPCMAAANKPLTSVDGGGSSTEVDNPAQAIIAAKGGSSYKAVDVLAATG